MTSFVSQLTAGHAKVVAFVLVCAACTDSGTGQPDLSPPADPLQLASCTGTAELARPLPFPSPTWTNPAPADTQATLCAFRGLDPLIPDRAIICSGEDAHGVAESTRTHALLARFLAHHRGVRTIVFEEMDANLAHAQAYVQTGDEAALTAYWKSQRVSLNKTVEHDLLLRALHALALELPSGQTLAIRGMDVAVQVNGTLDRLTAFYQKANAAKATELMVSAPRDQDITSPDVARTAADAMKTLVEDLTQNQPAYSAAAGEDAWQLASEDAQNLVDGYSFLIHYVANDFLTGDELFREPAMAKNLAHFANAATAPIMIVAHNAHCAKSNAIGTSPAVGTLIATDPALAERYRVLAQAYAEGTETMLDGGFKTTTVPMGTLGPALGAVDPSSAFLLATSSPAFASEMSWIGEYQNTFVPAADFDSFTFIRTVTPTTQLE
jgi:erythromycin esterase-like protein